MTNTQLTDAYIQAAGHAIGSVWDDDLDAALDAHARAGDVLRAEREARLMRAQAVLEESQRGAA